MSYSVFGNTNIGAYHTDRYEVEIEDEETGDCYEVEVEGDYIREMEFVGYKFTVVSASNDSSVDMFYYHRKPTSDYYMDMFWDPSYPVYPLIFLLDNNDTPIEVLNIESPGIILSDKKDGWYSVNVPLKRKLNKGDRIYFCFGGAVITPVFDEIYRIPYSEEAYNSYYMVHTDYNYSKFYSTTILKILSGEYLSDFRYYDEGKRFSLYLTYENEPENKNFLITVTGNIGLQTITSRKDIFKRILKNTVKNKEELIRKTELKKNICDDIEATDISKRIADIAFLVFSELVTLDVSTNNRIIKRLISTSKKLTSELKSGTLFIRGISENKNMTDESLRQLLLKRSKIETLLFFENFSKALSFKRIVFFFADINTELKRSGSSYRSTTDEVPVLARAFASRLFFRTVETFLSFWDWISGKIRGTNNIVSFYCPIDLEIEIETHI